MSFLNLTFMISWLALKVISVLFFFSWSSQITTLFLADSYTSTITLVLYIISTIAIFFSKPYTFFFRRKLPESFYRISKPTSVAIAKYSWLWLELIEFTFISCSGWSPFCSYWVLSCKFLNYSTMSASMQPLVVVTIDLSPFTTTFFSLGGYSPSIFFY